MPRKRRSTRPYRKRFTRRRRRGRVTRRRTRKMKSGSTNILSRSLNCTWGLNYQPERQCRILTWSFHGTYAASPATNQIWRANSLFDVGAALGATNCQDFADITAHNESFRVTYSKPQVVVYNLAAMAVENVFIAQVTSAAKAIDWDLHTMRTGIKQFRLSPAGSAGDHRVITMRSATKNIVAHENRSKWMDIDAVPPVGQDWYWAWYIRSLDGVTNLNLKFIIRQKMWTLISRKDLHT